ncbi:MAG TPA: hypothetical protein VJB37_00510 [Patescibacteria group bacterium]|nr:hypothetical protein [Patescibacteria group bacterium]
MKKKFSFIIILCLAVFCSLAFSVLEVGADYKTELQTQLKAAAGEQGANLGQARDPRLVATYIVQILLGTIGVIFTAYTVYAGFLIMTSRGESEQVDKAKTIIKYAVLGVLITLSAFSISLFVERYLREATTGGGGIDKPFYAGVEVKVDENMKDFNNPDPLGESTGLGQFWDGGEANTW